MNKILFDAHTPYQLMVATAIAYTYYSDAHTIILVGNALMKDTLRLKKDLEASKIFNQVEIAMEKEPKEILIDQLEKLELDTVDVFHFSSYSAMSSCYLFNRLYNRAKIILDEEGIATYDLFAKYDQYVKLFPSMTREDVDLSRLDEIWVFNAALYRSQYKQKVVQIDLSSMRNESYFICCLNRIFNYQYTEIKEKYIFFTQNFLDYGVVDYKEVQNFFKMLQQYLQDELLIKLHPFDNNLQMYQELQIKVLSGVDQVPWEVIVLNHLQNNALHEKTFLAVGSTALSIFHLFLKYRSKEDTNRYMLMSKMLQTPFNSDTERYYKSLSDLDSFKYCLVQKYSDLLS